MSTKISNALSRRLNETATTDPQREVPVIPTTSVDSALGLPPLFVRQIRPMITLLDPGDQLNHIFNCILP
jgi:hypothetical protein